MTLSTIARQAPLSMGFSKQEYWSGLPFPSPGDLPDPRIKPGSPALQTDSLPSEPPGRPCLAQSKVQSVMVTHGAPELELGGLGSVLGSTLYSLHDHGQVTYNFCDLVCLPVEGA